MRIWIQQNKIEARSGFLCASTTHARRPRMTLCSMGYSKVASRVDALACNRHAATTAKTPETPGGVYD